MISSVEMLLSLDPQYENRDRVETKIKEMDDISNFKPRHRKKKPDPYDGLCDGQETLYNTNHVTNLTCYLSNKHPLLMFRPLGVEVVSVSPPVMLFHNALTDKEVDDLINVAEPLVGLYLSCELYLTLFHLGGGGECLRRFQLSRTSLIFKQYLPNVATFTKIYWGTRFWKNFASRVSHVAMATTFLTPCLLKFCFF